MDSTPASATPADNTPSPSKSTGAQNSGLLKTQQSFTGSTSKLSEVKPSFTFKTASLHSTGEMQDNDSGASFEIGQMDVGSDRETELSEVVKSKLSPEPGHTDGCAEQQGSTQTNELRNRRLQRFDSYPSSVQQAVSRSLENELDAVPGQSAINPHPAVHRTGDGLGPEKQDNKQN